MTPHEDNKMQRYMKNPRVVLLECPLECKQADCQAHTDLAKDTNLENALRWEEEEMEKVCEEIVKVKPDLVITEMGVSDLAQHFLLKANISLIRNVSKTDNSRIARTTGATICKSTQELSDSTVGAECGCVRVKKIGDEFFGFFGSDEDTKRGAIVLRGASKDFRDHVMESAHTVTCNTSNVLAPKLAPCSGANEMEPIVQQKEHLSVSHSHEVAVTMELREEQVRLREANVALKETQLANRQELESIERARQVAAEELAQVQKQLEAYRREESALRNKLKCCRDVVARTVGCVDQLYEHQGKENTMRHSSSLPELNADTLMTEVAAVDAEAARMLASMADESTKQAVECAEGSC